jgi:hypothetical protein
MAKGFITNHAASSGSHRGSKIHIARLPTGRRPLGFAKAVEEALWIGS